MTLFWQRKSINEKNTWLAETSHIRAPSRLLTRQMCYFPSRFPASEVVCVWASERDDSIIAVSVSETEFLYGTSQPIRNDLVFIYSILTIYSTLLTVYNNSVLRMCVRCEAQQDIGRTELFTRCKSQVDAWRIWILRRIIPVPSLSSGQSPLTEGVVNK